MPKEVTIVQCVRRQEKAPDEEESSRHSCACPSCPAHNTLRSDQNLSKPNSTTERISTEMLIEAVKRRPILWNPEHPEHAKREERQRLWAEVVHEFYGSDVKQDQKSYLSMLLQERWRNLTTCFSKELTRKRRLELGLCNGACKAEFTYYKQLYFLKDAVHSQTDVDHSISDEENDNNQLDPKHSAYDMIYNPKEDIITNTKASQPKKLHFTSKDSADRAKCKMKPNAEKSKTECKNKADDNFEYGNDLKIEKVKSEPLENTNNLKNHKDNHDRDTCPEKPDALKDSNEIDEDRLFLLSLLKPLQTIPKSYKLPTKIKLMEIIHKAQDESGVFQRDKSRR